MNRPEKIARITLAICAVCIAGFLALFFFAGPAAASSMFGVLGFSGFLPFLYRGEGPPDERDRRILNRATRISGLVFWMLFVAVFMGIWSISMMRGVTVISIQVLPVSVIIGWIVLFSVHALSTIIQYRRGIDHGET